jgi:hypothetical protein
VHKETVIRAKADTDIRTAISAYTFDTVRSHAGRTGLTMTHEHHAALQITINTMLATLTAFVYEITY